MPKNTSWDNVAHWYDDILENSDDSYQKNVIVPNLLRLIAPDKGMTILDLACGQGYFSRVFSTHGAKVIGCDISEELIKLAKQNMKDGYGGSGAMEFRVSPAHDLSFLPDSSIDRISIVLALQNIENLSGTLVECTRVMKTDGRLFIVMNHPAFRIPRNSSWQLDEKNGTQFRRIDSYMSEKTVKIDMTPGEQDIRKKKFTVTFHRPLQSYFKALNKAGLSVSRLEEWISHRKSQKGPHSSEEDRVRKEIPMFLCMECSKR